MGKQKVPEGPRDNLKDSMKTFACKPIVQKHTKRAPRWLSALSIQL